MGSVNLPASQGTTASGDRSISPPRGLTLLLSWLQDQIVGRCWTIAACQTRDAPITACKSLGVVWIFLRKHLVHPKPKILVINPGGLRSACSLLCSLWCSPSPCPHPKMHLPHLFMRALAQEHATMWPWQLHGPGCVGSKLNP